MKSLKNVQQAFNIGFHDPKAALYSLKSRQKLVNLKLTQLLRTKADVSCYSPEIQEIDNYINRQLISVHYEYDCDIIFRQLLYVICRILHPSKVIETGVCSGMSTTYILSALQKNGKGELYSIDLPNYEKIVLEKCPDYLPKQSMLEFVPKEKETGWLVPDHLRERWHLKVGLTNDLLPELCDSLGEIDVFLHDSEHTYENMFFEYLEVWPHLKRYLLSHDTGRNKAFSDFCTKVGVKPINFYSTSLAGARKIVP